MDAEKTQDLEISVRMKQVAVYVTSVEQSYNVQLDAVDERYVVSQFVDIV